MGETNGVVKDERPIFRVMQAPGFATGLKMYQPGEEVVWAKPEGWDSAKNGKHFAEHGPSLSFQAVNPPAEKMLEDLRKQVADRNQPKPTADDTRFAKLEAMHLQMMNAMLEQQAENRRLREKLEESEEKSGKKK